MLCVQQYAEAWLSPSASPLHHHDCGALQEAPTPAHCCLPLHFVQVRALEAPLLSLLQQAADGSAKFAEIQAAQLGPSLWLPAGVSGGAAAGGPAGGARTPCAAALRGLLEGHVRPRALPHELQQLSNECVTLWAAMREGHEHMKLKVLRACAVRKCAHAGGQALLGLQGGPLLRGGVPAQGLAVAQAHVGPHGAGSGHDAAAAMLGRGGALGTGAKWWYWGQGGEFLF